MTARAVKKPLSAVRMQDGRFMCVLKQGQALVLDVDLTDSKEGNSMLYFAVTPEDQPIPFASDYVSDYLLLLPYLCDGAGYFYTVVSSDWKELFEDGELCLPSKLKEKTT